MSDFLISKGGKIVRDLTLVDVYFQEPVPIPNITRVDSILEPTLSSGVLLVSSFPSGIDYFNRNLGMIIDYNIFTQTSGIFNQMTESNLHRAGISISGAVVAGKR